MTDAPVIEVDDLTKYYGDVRGIEDLTFDVDPGETFGFLGPNGAGKSTAIRTMLGLLKPTRGSVRLLGRDMTDRTTRLEAKRKIGYISGDVAFYDRITGERILDYFGHLKGEQRREELLERFPIPNDRAVREYSRGNRQKLAIVQAFMHAPELVIMDEPTAGLDPLLQNEFYELLAEEQAHGVTAFFSSHILSEVRRTCDRVAVIRNGQLVTVEDIDVLLRKSGKVVSVDLAESPDPSVFEFEGIARVTVEDDGVYNLILTENYDELIDRLDEYTVRNLEIRETSLEDVFIHFYGEEEEFAPEERVSEPDAGADSTEFEAQVDGDV